MQGNIPYSINPVNVLSGKFRKITSFISRDEKENIDWKTVDSFGAEWSRFDSFSNEEIEKIGKEYFDIVPTNVLNGKSYVLDVGCGSGRWSKFIAHKVGYVEAVDPSSAVIQADSLIGPLQNVRISQAEVDNLPFPDDSFDLVFSLGVLHHIPDTKKAMEECVKKVKPGGYFLVYLYYSLDNRGWFYKMIFHLSNLLRRVISNLPQGIKIWICDCLAIVLYLPFIGFSTLLKKIKIFSGLASKIPLSYYSNKSFKIIRNDSLDRFGTPLEQRFSKKEIESMMKKAGLENVVFSGREPFWHAIGQKVK